jgi:hypothetical protein
MRKNLWDIVEPLVIQAYSSTMSKGLMFRITTSTPSVLIIAQVESLKTQKRKTLTIMNLSIHDKIIPYVVGI